MAQRPKGKTKNYEKKTKKKLHDTGFSNEFLDIVQRIQLTKEIDKLDCIKIKTFCASIGTTNK